MRILYATSEAAPYWKTGGLAEVGQSLPDTLVQRGHEVRVVMPLYRPVRDSHLELEDAGAALIPWPGGGLRARYFLHTPTRGAPALFVDQPTYFDTRHPYGAPGEDPVVVGLRYAFFCRAVVERARAWNADVVQLNDWQTGLVPLYALLDGMPAASVFTIHNLGYQGNFAPGLLDFIGIPRTYLRPDGHVVWFPWPVTWRGPCADRTRTNCAVPRGSAVQVGSDRRRNSILSRARYQSLLTPGFTRSAELVGRRTDARSNGSDVRPTTVGRVARPNQRARQ